jgi:DNA polymerase-3 subunit chi
VATRVEFHTGVAEPLGFACRLLRKAWRSGARLLVTAPPPWLDELDRALWTFEERDFVPHVRLTAAGLPHAARTPIWLAPAAPDAAAGRVLVNVGADAPALPVAAAAFVRIVEVVAADADAAAAGRERWRAYKAAGLEIQHHPARTGG